MIKKKKKRCLLVVHRFYPFMGGAERLFLRWAQQLEKLGYRVDVFTTNVWDNDFFHFKTKRYIKLAKQALGNIFIRRFRIFHPPNKINLFMSLSKLPIKYLKYIIGFPYIFLPGYYAYMFFKKLLRNKYDFVLAGVYPHYCLVYPALAYAKSKNIPFISVPLMHFGEPNSKENFNLYFNEKSKEILENSTLILTETKMEKEKLVSYDYDREKIITAGIGIDVNKVAGGNSSRFKKKYDIDSPIVLQISTQTHEKGAHHIVEAMKILWKNKVNVKLVLIGQILKDFEVYLLMQEAYVFENTIILNYISEQEKKDALDACDIFAMTSRSESFGLTYLEAWLYKKPVIGAFCSGVMELIEDGTNGYLVPFGDKGMLSEYIVKLLGDKYLRNKMGLEGYNKVIRKYTWQKRLVNFNKVIESIK